MSPYPLAPLFRKVPQRRGLGPCHRRGFNNVDSGALELVRAKLTANL
jgi:hypothetical protein